MISISFWNQLTFDNERFFPVFSFEPTLSFLETFRERGSSCRVTISGTGGVYDGTYLVRFDQMNTCSPPTPLYVGFIESIPFTTYPTDKGYVQWDVHPIRESYLSNNINNTQREHEHPSMETHVVEVNSPPPLPTAPSWSEFLQEESSSDTPSRSTSVLHDEMNETNEYVYLWLVIVVLMYGVILVIEMVVDSRSKEVKK